MLDTGANVPESLETLKRQQVLLVTGRRRVQMFPVGTPELELPRGMLRCVNARGVFHYDPDWISAITIKTISAQGKENLFLMLGPFSKPDILKRIERGEFISYVTEYAPDGVEIRSALGTTKTTEIQRQYFEATKEPENTIEVGPPPIRVRQLLRS